MFILSRRWIGRLFVIVLINGIAFVGPTANANSIELEGDTEIVNGDRPYNDLQMLRLGAGQEDPPEGKLVVKDGAFLSDYHYIFVGGYIPLDRGNFPIPVLPYEGTMVVKGVSVVDVGGTIDVGTFPDSLGKLTISDNSIVRTAGGVLPIKPFRIQNAAFHIADFEGSEGEVILSDGSELSVLWLRLGDGGRGVLRAENQSRVISGPFVNIGRGETGDGYATFRDASSFHILGDDGEFGAFMNIGRSGRGELRLIESELLIDGEVPDLAFEGGFQLGRNPTGHGTVMLRDSTFTVRNMTEPFVAMGRAGFGSLVLKGNSTLVVEDQDGVFAVAASRRGVFGEAVVSIGPDSLVDAGGLLLLCLDFDGVTPAGTAEINVQGILRAAEIRVGLGCTIDGKGTIEGNVINLGGSISEGITIVP